MKSQKILKIKAIVAPMKLNRFSTRENIPESNDTIMFYDFPVVSISLVSMGML